MGEFSLAPLLLDFDARLRLEFHGASITSAGLLAVRELDDALGLTHRAIDFLTDARTGLNIKHQFPALLRQSVFSRIAGYHDMNDADRLASDPTLRLITGRFDPTRSAASSRTLGRFEADVLAREETCEQWIKEGKYALNWTRLSCHRFSANRARFGLFVLAYNLANFIRRLALPKEVERWSLQTIKVRLVKTGARLVRRARQLTMQMAEVAVPRRLWTTMPRRIGELRSG